MKMIFIFIIGARTRTMHRTMLSLLALASLAIACGDKGASDDTGGVSEADTDTDTDTDADADTDTDTDADADHAYAFESDWAAGESSVSYSGQVARQVLILDLKAAVGGLTSRIDGGWFPEAGEVQAELGFYLDFDSETSGMIAHSITTDPAAAQTTHEQISTGKNLVGKIAGNDATGQHKDWSTEFVGWTHPGVSTPESLVRHWFSQLDGAALAWSAGDYPLGPDGSPTPGIHVTAQGQDLQQLLQKFLTGAVTFSQGTDDYLDDDIEGKGLNADHTGPDDEGDPYSALEHGWDEGFGYFGASRYYSSLDDLTIQDVGYADSDGDGSIDLKSEFCFAASVNAAKRDAGASEEAPTDFTAMAWEGFHAGRSLIAENPGGLDEHAMAALQGHRDQAVSAWEMAAAATVVHYINDVLQDMSGFGSDDYSFEDHAKHWSEMKGFALWMQFNPRSLLSDVDFAALHTAIGTAPVLPSAAEADILAYRAALIDARAILAESYSFDAANIGDESGENGW